MAATLSEAIDRSLTAGDAPGVPEVLAALARGALYGARGNSGVILSQALRGFAAGVGDRDHFDAEGLARGLAAAAQAAYTAVSKPEEGTMLTVLRCAGEEARTVAAAMAGNGRNTPCLTVLAAAVEAADAAEAKTIDQLPALREAGVPDAGGEGICVILRGLLAAIRGEAPPAPIIPERPIAALAGHQMEEFGFCTEFLVEAAPAPLDLAVLRAAAAANSNTSVVVVGDERAAHVHAHASNPDALLGAAGALGRLSRVKVEDMAAQHRRFQASGSGASARVTVLALSHGAGFDAVFESLGAKVWDLGEVVKPPAGEIASAADAIRSADVIVLANHKNVVLAARQAASLTQCTLHVVATQTLPQGIAAAMAFSPEEGAAENTARMDAARSDVRSVEVTIAAADRRADGIDVRAGQAIAMVDGRLVASVGDLVDALMKGLDKAGAQDGGLVTIYAGSDVPAAQMAAARDQAAAAFPRSEVEAVQGGQPLYPFIASVEK